MVVLGPGPLLRIRCGVCQSGMKQRRMGALAHSLLIYLTWEDRNLGDLSPGSLGRKTGFVPGQCARLAWRESAGCPTLANNRD